MHTFTVKLSGSRIPAFQSGVVEIERFDDIHFGLGIDSYAPCHQPLPIYTAGSLFNESLARLPMTPSASPRVFANSISNLRARSQPCLTELACVPSPCTSMERTESTLLPFGLWWYLEQKVRKCIAYATKPELIALCLLTKQIDDIEHLTTLLLRIVEPCEGRRHAYTSLGSKV